MDLFRNFYYGHESSQSAFDSKIPEFMIAKASSAKNPTESIICAYDDYENKWRKILDDNYIYSIANNGHIIIAIEKNKKVNEFIYSYDYGKTWLTYKFTRKLVIIDDLIKDPVAHTQSFTLLARNAYTKTNLIFKFDFVNQLKEEDTQIKFNNCNQTCIDKDIFEETCVSEKEVEMKCLLTNKFNLELIDCDDCDEEIIKSPISVKFIACVDFLNRYIIPIFITLSVLFLLLVILVVLTRTKTDAKSNFILSKIVSSIKYFKSKKLNARNVIYLQNDQESLINHINCNNNDKTLYMLNTA